MSGVTGKRRLPNVLEQHIVASAPKMVCGVVVYGEEKKVLDFRFFENASSTPELDSMLPAGALEEAERSGEVTQVVCCLADDMRETAHKYQEMSDRDGLKYMLVLLPSNEWIDICPSGKFDDYEGRPYILGKYDCYSLVRDYFLNDLGVFLKDYPRNLSALDRNTNIFEQHLPEEGFFKIEDGDLRPGDFLLLNAPGSSRGHAAVYVGDGLMLHHHSPKKSCYEAYSEIWKECTRSVWRYKKLISQ